VCLVDFAGATIAPSPDQIMTDRTQLLAATATLAGGGRAVRTAVDALGTDGVAALLPICSRLRSAPSCARR
jgi:hypothetical protein